ncbi:MAG: heme-binding protein [Bacteroidetes bacterium]|nr:heme-binding protein [Bacteroidota bacterium]
MRKKKMMIYISIVLVLIVLFWQTGISSGTEQRSYVVEKVYDGFEVRTYTSVVMASVEQNGEMMETGNTSFRTLAGYIFGGNVGGKKIAMTAPVVMQPGTEASTTRMSFVMPNGYDLSTLPAPQTSSIRLHEEAGYRMAVIRFGGFVSNKDIKEKADKLRQQLKKENIAFVDVVIYMGYNPPFQLINRRNEVGFILK